MSMTDILLAGILIVLIVIAYQIKSLYGYLWQRDYDREHPDSEDIE